MATKTETDPLAHLNEILEKLPAGDLYTARGVLRKITQQFESHQKTLQATTEKLTGTQKRLAKHTITEAVRNAADGADLIEQDIDIASLYLTDSARVDPETGKIEIIDPKTGIGRLNRHGRPMSVSDWLAEYTEARPHTTRKANEGRDFMRGEKGKGGERGGLYRSQMSNAQKAHYISEHGQAKYLALPWDPPGGLKRSRMTDAEKVAFIRANGKAKYLALPA